MNDDAYGKMDGRPIVEIDRITSGPNGNLAYIEPCPLCDKDHKHGLREKVPAMSSRHSVLSHRAAHCASLDASGGYWVIVTEKTENATQDDDGDWILAYE